MQIYQPEIKSELRIYKCYSQLKMRNLIYIVVIIVCLFSCKQNINDYDITGKWYSYSPELGYAEYEIDSGLMRMYTHYGGNISPLEYYIENDTLKDKNRDEYYSKLIIINDTSFRLENIYETIVLYRLADSVLTFNEFDMHNDSIYKIFQNDYFERIIQSWVKFDNYDRNDTIMTREDSIRWGDLLIKDTVPESDSVIIEEIQIENIKEK